MPQFFEQRTEQRLQLAKKPAKYDRKHPGDNQLPKRHSNIRGETTADHIQKPSKKCVEDLAQMRKCRVDEDVRMTRG